MLPKSNSVDHDETNECAELENTTSKKTVERSIGYSVKQKTASIQPLEPGRLENSLPTVQNMIAEHPKITVNVNKTQKGPQKPFLVAKIGLQRSENTSLNALSYNEKELTSVPEEVIDNKSNLTLLDLTSNRFIQFPAEILQLSNLKVLRIDYNKIKTLPQQIGQLQSLECFTMSNNLLQFFPNTMSQLKRLSELNFEFNLIDSIDPQIIELKNLRIMNMNRNRFAEFPCSFYKMSSIIELSFEWYKYASPPLAGRQRGKEGEARIQKLRESCEKLAANGQKGVNFMGFVKLVSVDEPKLDVLDDMQRSFLHYSALYEDISVMKYMISNMPLLLDLADLEGHTPLSLSIVKEKYLAARYLLKHGANPVKGGGVFGSPLHITTRKLNLQIVRDIANLGENLNKIDADGWTPLHHAISLMSGENPRAIPITQFLLENGVNPNAKNKEGWAPLHLVLRKKDLKTLQWIFTYNKEAHEVHGREEVFNLNKRGGIYYWTPLHIACNTEAFEILEELALSGCDPFKRCLNGSYPKALIRGHGVTLKAIEKYERSWMHSRILFKNNNDIDFVDDSNLKNLNSTQEIKSASKNKFDSSFSSQRDEMIISPLRPERVRLSNIHVGSKSKVLVPIMMTQKVISKKFDDSFEILPETETNDCIGDSSETIGKKLDFFTELNENVTIESNTFNRGSNIGSRINIIETVRQTRSPSIARFTSGTIQFLEKDITCYQSYLNNEAKFNTEFCKNEVKLIKELFQTDRLIFTEKIKLFTMLRTLFIKILDHIQTNLKVCLNKEILALLSMKSSAAMNLKNVQPTTKKSDLHKATVLYELVPKCLIELYAKLSSSDYENSFLKNTIIYMLVETSYFPAIEFLEAIEQKSSELILLKQEAKQAVLTLKNLHELSMTHRVSSGFCNTLQEVPPNFEKPRSIKPYINSLAEETRQNPLFTTGPSFNAKPLFSPVRIAGENDKLL